MMGARRNYSVNRGSYRAYICGHGGNGTDGRMWEGGQSNRRDSLISWTP